MIIIIKCITIVLYSVRLSCRWQQNTFTCLDGVNYSDHINNNDYYINCNSSSLFRWSCIKGGIPIFPDVLDKVCLS